MQYGSNVQLNNPTPKYSLPYNSVADPSTKRHANAIILPNRICNYKDPGAYFFRGNFSFTIKDFFFSE